jgi:hypothetical protein
MSQINNLRNGHKSNTKFNKIMNYPLEFYKTKVQNDTRILQAEILEDILKKHFNFDKIECIETGCSSGNYDDFGIYLSKLCELNSGKFITVDISEDKINESKKLYLENIGEFDSEFYTMDSVDFLKKYEGSPNLVHLDSWDLDLLNPIPSMLHCWLEFNEIKDKMPSGSICLIDDNYFKNTWVNYHDMINGVITVNNNLSVIGNTLIDKLITTGESTFNNNVTINNNTLLNTLINGVY